MKNERKEELKDEMKNRISLALKDPILQQGFEIICKENAELKEKLNIRSCQNCRKYNRTCPNDGSCKNYSKWEGCENPQLTEAKEHIENLLYYVKQCTCERSNYAEIEKDIKEAEQFLKNNA